MSATQSVTSIGVPFTGGCACGAVRYSCDEAPLAMFNCHCRDCQRASGGAFVTVALIRETALRMLNGQPKFHRTVGEAGRWTDRGFCTACGTPLFAKGEVGPGYMTIKPGSLDDPTWFKPTIDSWVGSAPTWMPQDTALPKTQKSANLLRNRTIKPSA